MDVLIKLDKIPDSLKSISNEAISNLLIRALWRNQHHSEASPTSPASVYILSSVEEALGQWVRVLPSCVRQEIVGNVSKLLISHLGTGLGFRSQTHHAYNPLPVLIASSLEILYDGNFRELDIVRDLEWSKESRGKVLHLVHKNLNNGVERIDFSCYKVITTGWPKYGFSNSFAV